MRTRRCIIHGRLRDDSVCIANEEQVKRVLLVLRPMQAQISHYEVARGILLHLHLGQVEEGGCRVLLIQQVIAIAIVNFKVADIDLKLARCMLSNMRKDV